jgi:hypothetical protein
MHATRDVIAHSHFETNLQRQFDNRSRWFDNAFAAAEDQPARDSIVTQLHSSPPRPCSNHAQLPVVANIRARRYVVTTRVILHPPLVPGFFARARPVYRFSPGATRASRLERSREKDSTVLRLRPRQCTRILHTGVPLALGAAVQVIVSTHGWKAFSR